jgi:hypothetical protein
MIASSFMHGFPPFLTHFAAAKVLVFLFIVIWCASHLTAGIALIRDGNKRCHQFVGALLGYSIALASAIANSVAFADMLLWGGIALAVPVCLPDHSPAVTGTGPRYSAKPHRQRHFPRGTQSGNGADQCRLYDD